MAQYVNEVSTYDPNYVKKFGLILFNNASEFDRLHFLRYLCLEQGMLPGLLDD